MNTVSQINKKFDLGSVVTIPTQDKQTNRDIYFTGKVSAWGTDQDGTCCVVRGFDGAHFKCQSWKVMYAKSLDRLLYA